MGAKMSKSHPDARRILCVPRLNEGNSFGFSGHSYAVEAPAAAAVPIEKLKKKHSFERTKLPTTRIQEFQQERRSALVLCML